MKIGKADGKSETKIEERKELPDKVSNMRKYLIHHNAGRKIGEGTFIYVKRFCMNLNKFRYLMLMNYETV